LHPDSNIHPSLVFDSTRVTKFIKSLRNASLRGKLSGFARCCKFAPQIVYWFGLFDLFYCFEDDMIDDAESFVNAAKLLKERGAYKILVMVTHGLLSADAPELIEESVIDEV